GDDAGYGGQAAAAPAGQRAAHDEGHVQAGQHHDAEDQREEQPELLVVDHGDIPAAVSVSQRRRERGVGSITTRSGVLRKRPPATSDVSTEVRIGASRRSSVVSSLLTPSQTRNGPSVRIGNCGKLFGTSSVTSTPAGCTPSMR